MSLASLPLAPERPIGQSPVVDVAALRNDLTASVAGEIRFDRLSRALYSTDASIYQIVPLGVVLPKTEADIVATLKACARFHVPLTARGGGTSQAGQAIGPGLILDCSKYLGEVLEINATERWARVQPGCVLDDLNLAVKAHGLQFAPDISTSNRATIGGMIANNSCGTHSLLYGKTIDHVLELKVVLADGSMIQLQPLDEQGVEAKCRQADLEGAGYRKLRALVQLHAAEIDRRFPKLLRRVGGYNLDRFLVSRRAGLRQSPETAPLDAQILGALTQPRSPLGALTQPRSPAPFNMAELFVGSEGTLGITLEAKLRLVELPSAKALLVVQFADLLDALAATPAILSHAPSAVEVLDKYVLDSTRLNPEAARLRDFLEGDPGAVLLIEFYGIRADELPPRLEALEADLRRQGRAVHFHRAIDPAAQSRIWKLRKLALGLSMAEKGDAKAISFVEDSAVAPEKLRDYIAEFLAIVARHGTTAGVYAHASVGCLHVRPVINLKTVEGVQQFEAIAAEVADLVLKYGGALSGEHGDGLVRSPFQEKMFGPALYQAFRELKNTFDPLHILNPGKIVDAPPLSSHLRYGPAYVTPEVATTFDFAADGGLARAAELCAGVGECRKKRDGTMCPSYQATREEQHSTRGRANALRLALTRGLGSEGLTDPSLREVFDLCLECKACKSECPTNVDMARLKAEFLDQYYRKHGLPWRGWVFGNVAKLSSWGARLPSLANRVSQARLGRWLQEKLLGIDRRRMPPALAEHTLTWHLIAQGLLPQEADSRVRVLFFPDTFTEYYEPMIGLAAMQLLHALGSAVLPGLADGFSSAPWKPEHWPSHLRCCGRPLISNGMLAKAVEYARHNVERLYPWVADTGNPIIACEPSCLLTIKDDYPALLRGELRRQAEAVAAACQTFEEYLESQLSAKAELASRLVLQERPKKILVQGHCHQRALTGLQPTLRLLRRIPKALVIDLDAGCCGMAGSFGYEKEHYEISRAVGEQRLFPALREAGSDTVIVAPGFSCRRQIEHFTARTALHPAELLARLAVRTPADPARPSP
jgi:FAD/FMN-containing dehydrogenase/Fe-S oxidoreductase